MNAKTNGQRIATIMEYCILIIIIAMAIVSFCIVFVIPKTISHENALWLASIKITFGLEYQHDDELGTMNKLVAIYFIYIYPFVSAVILSLFLFAYHFYERHTNYFFHEDLENVKNATLIFLMFLFGVFSVYFLPYSEPLLQYRGFFRQKSLFFIFMLIVQMMLTVTLTLPLICIYSFFSRLLRR